MKTANTMQKVERPIIGRKYHLSWAKRGCVWRLVSIDGEYCKLVTPATKKEITAKISDLRHLNSNNI